MQLRSAFAKSTGIACAVTVWLFIVLVAGCGKQAPDRLAEGPPIPEKIDFNFHIKPILADRCFPCHGPDKNKQKAGLALHEKDLALAELAENPGHFAIVPGKPSKSELYRRIISTDPDQLMPPPESNLNLSPYEILVLKKWIEQGAEYRPHWSFIPPVKPGVPAVADRDWVRNPIDAFVAARLEKEGQTPAPEADRETLIRRLSFDLTGLPPTLEEVDAFVTDDSPDAYEKLVDRLLASPAYGERMAAYWLDVARYADSDGYLDDKHREFSPWRDWVIKAFNQNMSYRDFITWQLAGDLLPNATKDQVLATAFNRLHKRNSEAGIVFEEFRVEYVADRTNTLGKAVMGMSLECARCHDHKYDPVSQEEYFQLFAFFNSTNEFGHAVYGPDQTPGPALLLTDDEVEARRKLIDKLVREQEKSYRQSVQGAETGFEKWLAGGGFSHQAVQQWLDQNLVAWYPLDQLTQVTGERAQSPDRSKKGKYAALFNPELKPGARGNAFFVTDLSSGRLAEKDGWFERTEAFSIDLWLYPDTLYEEAGIFQHSEELRLGFKGYSLHLNRNRPTFILAHSWPQNAIQITATDPLPIRKWSKLTITYDGSSRAAGLHLFMNGKPAPVESNLDHLYKGILFKPDIHTYGFNGFTFGQRDKIKAFKNGGIDEIRIFRTALTPLEVQYLFDPGAVRAGLADLRDPATAEQLKGEYIARVDGAVRTRLDDLRLARQRANALYDSIPEIMVMGDLPKPRPTFVLSRGNYDAPGKEVSPGVPSRVFPFPDDLPANRLGLAEWLFDPRHPLTARVIVNRIWQLHFGKGIVKTSEDFGNQGELPSHPELLDWLAVRFVESGWDLKALHKLIVESAVYRQSSAITPALQAFDPENRLLARGPRFRLPAEMIRDNALAISGLLVSKQGGPSAYPYQPEGLWDELSNKSWRYKYLQEPGEGLYRRSIYTIWKRTSPPPSMVIFDVGDRDVCTVRRRTTNTPLQALVLLNDPQYQEACRVLAEGVIRNTGNDDDVRLTRVFRLVLGRRPDAKEMDLMRAYYAAERKKYEARPADALAYLGIGETPRDPDLEPADVAALSLVANSLMNTNEGTAFQ
ncbi:MAG: DUF1553 domain-containing protein [Lewinellaceae bacterium]|nr:DUF1553 domain-containing protein [Lewinellaceae bacterium]